MAGNISGLRKSPFFNMRKTKSFWFKNFNKLFYTTGAYDGYLQRFDQEGKNYALRIVDKIKPPHSWKFLDVGCGMGGIVLGLRKLGYQAWGTEVSPYCLRYSPAKKWIKFADISYLPFHNGLFEIVLCIDVLYYLTKKESEKAIKELIRVAKGYIYLDTICKGSPNSLQTFNPDPLRKNESLLTAQELKNIFAANQAFFLGSLFERKEKTDFNGIFKK